MKSTELTHFRALIDVFLDSIKKQNYALTENISRFFYDAFRKKRAASPNEPVVYPIIYYELVSKTIEELAIMKNKRNEHLEKLSAGSKWLLGEFEYFNISETTYSFMWKNLLLAINYERDDMVLFHWETAHTYLAHSLHPIQHKPIWKDDKFEMENSEEVKKRDEERIRFIEFHYALGGVLLYMKRYECIHRLFEYTTSYPPKYELLPESMNEIFKFYNKLQDPYDKQYSWISHAYPFPNQSGIQADFEIKKWISSYMALLFIRQYSIRPYLITMTPLDYPLLPNTQSEKQQWIDSLILFKKLVKEHLENDKLLNALNFTQITIERCNEVGVPYPLDFLESLTQKLKEAYSASAIDLSISAEKEDLFYNSSRDIIESTLNKYSKISNQSQIEGDVDVGQINGLSVLQNKDAFSQNPEVHHFDYESFLAYGLAETIHEGIASTFLLKRKKTYLLKPEDIFESIDRLGINSNYIIVCFGINLEFYNLSEIVLTDQKYKNIEIYSFPGTRITNSSLFILEKSDLPSISTEPIEVALIDKYSLIKISDHYNIYSKVLDLNLADPAILREHGKNQTEEELKKSVLMSIFIKVNIKWKKKVNMIHILEYSEFRQDGLPNNLSEIKPI